MEQRGNSATDCWGGSGCRGARIVALVASALFLCAVLPPILLRSTRGPAWTDQWGFHLVTIDRFAQQWPRPDLSNYPATATPLYHLILAAVDVYVSQSVTVLRVCGALFTLGLVATMAWWCGKRVGSLLGVLLCAVLIADVFIYSRAVHIGPDNAGWWCMTAALMLALRGRHDAWFFVGGGALLLVTVATRQVHIWTAGLLCLSAWLGDHRSATESQVESCGVSARIGEDLLSGFGGRLVRTLPAILMTLPAFALLLWFMRMWGGPVPPLVNTTPEHPDGGYEFHQLPVRGGNVATPALVLALFGVFGPFYLIVVWPALRDLLGRRGDHRAAALRWLALGAAVGLALGAAPATDFDPKFERTGDIWSVAAKLPVVAHRSMLVVGLATLGGAVVAAYWMMLDRRARWLFLAAIAGFTAAQLPAFTCWQRYAQPAVLVFLTLFTVRVLRAGHDSNPPPAAAVVAPGGGGTGLALRTGRFAVPALLMLVCLQGAITALKFKPAPIQRPERAPTTPVGKNMLTPQERIELKGIPER